MVLIQITNLNTTLVVRSVFITLDLNYCLYQMSLFFICSENMFDIGEMNVHYILEFLMCFSPI